MRRTLPHLAEILRQQIWLIPASAAVAAAIAVLGLLWLGDRTGDLGLGVAVDPVSARALLSAIATAMISFTALVFSITMLVLQMASTQLSPRVMRTFLRDRFIQAVLGLFVATFVFALLLLVSIGSDDVPQLAVLVSIALVLVSVLAFVAYIDHMAHDIQASTIINAIASETRQAIERLYPEDAVEPDTSDQPGPPSLPAVVRTVPSPHSSGYVVVIDEGKLATHAAKGGYVIEMLAGSGDFVVQGEPLFAIRGGPSDRDVDEATEAIRMGEERTMNQDVGFGFRQLIDIALRALSPGINDQTTADRVIDRLHDLLRMLRDRPLPAARQVHHDGSLRVLVPSLDWDGFLLSTVLELHDSSRELPHVDAHLRRVLEALAVDAPPHRVAAIRRALNLLDGQPPGETALA